MSDFKIYKPGELNGFQPGSVQLQQKAQQIKQRFDYRRNFFHTSRNSVLDYDLWIEINDKLTAFDLNQFAPWNRKWATVQRGSNIDQLIQFFEEGNEAFATIEDAFRAIKSTVINSDEIESLQKELMVKIEQDVLKLKTDVLVQINEGINSLVNFKAETGLNRIFSDSIEKELKANIAKRSVFMWSFIISLLLISLALTSSFYTDFIQQLDLVSKISLKLALSIPLGFLSYFFFSQYRLYQMISLKLSHLNGFLGGGATYLGQLIEQDMEVKREINKRLAQMFIELDDIMINIKDQRHPTESAINGVVSKVDSLSKSVSEILKKIKE